MKASKAILKQYGLDCLRGASLHGARLYGAILRSADLHDANLGRADLSGANLHDRRQVTCLILSGDIRSGMSCDWANAKETE